MVLGIIGGVALLALFTTLWLWTRRSEREIEIPRRQLTADEEQSAALQRQAVVNIIGGIGIPEAPKRH